MSQKELIEMLLKDPEKGIEAIIESYSGLVYKIIRHRLAFLSQSDIEEAVSDVFYDIYRYRSKIDSEKGSLSSFIITIAQRRAVDIFRKRKNEVFSEISDEDMFSSIPDPDNFSLKEEERSLLISAVVSLGEPDSTIVFRKYFLGEKHSEIGKILGLSENAVGKRLRKSLEKLKVIMKEENSNG